MKQGDDKERARSVQARLAAVVIAVAMLVWVLGNLLGQQYQWGNRYVFLLDIAVLAAFVWALVVVWRIWRARRDETR